MWESFVSLMLSKPGVLSIITFMLLIPLGLINAKIDERSGYYGQVVNEISQSWTGVQTLTGPILVVEYQVRSLGEKWNEARRKNEVRELLTDKVSFLAMHELTTRIDIVTELRYRGIHKVPVYAAAIEMSGIFNNAEIKRIVADSQFQQLNRIYFWLAVTDQRGFLDIPVLNWSSKDLLFEAGGHHNLGSKGIRVDLNLEDLLEEENVAFAVVTRLKGTQHLNLVPSARSNTFEVVSNWPHPKFTGRYLPTERNVHGDGFQAKWHITELASNISLDLANCAAGDCNAIGRNNFGIDLIEPVSIYVQANRAVKYGILFVVLVFSGVLAVEIVKQVRVHPLQYMLVGAALAMFYLLLVSLSEHVPFHLAYLIASILCTSLLTYYCVYILKGLRDGVCFGVGVGVLFALLYVILQLEDFALLVGSLMTFLSLAGLMVVTRSEEKIRTLSLRLDA